MLKAAQPGSPNYVELIAKSESLPAARQAARDYAADVRAGTFPGPEHTFRRSP